MTASADEETNADRPDADSAVTVASLVGSARDIFETHTTTAVVGGLFLLGSTVGLVWYAVTASLSGTALAVAASLGTAFALRRRGASPRIVFKMLLAAVLWLLFAPTAARVREWHRTGAEAGAIALVLIPVAFSVWAMYTASSDSSGT